MIIFAIFYISFEFTLLWLHLDYDEYRRIKEAEEEEEEE